MHLSSALGDHARRTRTPLGKLFTHNFLEVLTGLFHHFWVQAAVSLLKPAITLF
jgi:hypothetical protein